MEDWRSLLAETGVAPSYSNWLEGPEQQKVASGRGYMQ
jgi:hypothetical protein